MLHTCIHVNSTSILCIKQFKLVIKDIKGRQGGKLYYSVQETFCGIHDRIGGLWLKTEAQNLEGV